MKIILHINLNFEIFFKPSYVFFRITHNMIKMIHFLLIIFGLVNCKFSDVVQTTKGPVQGKILSTVINSIKYSSFNGIPYAEPPLGCNRFRVIFFNVHYCYIHIKAFNLKNTKQYIFCFE